MDDTKLDAPGLLELRLAVFFRPTSEQWRVIMAHESAGMVDRAKRIADELAREIQHGLAVSEGLEKPDAWELAKSSKWGTFGEWAQAWVSLQLFLASGLLGAVLARLHNKAGEESGWGQLLWFPGAAAALAQVAAAYYVLRAIF